MSSIWNFIQDEILGMQWLKRLKRGAERLRAESRRQDRRKRSVFHLRHGQDPDPIGHSDLFYLLYTEFFPSRENEKDPRQISRYPGEHSCRFARNGHAFLLMLVDPPVHGFYERGSASRRNVLVSDLLPYGRSRKSCASDEHFRLESGCHLRCSRDCDRGCGRHFNRKTAS